MHVVRVESQFTQNHRSYTSIPKNYLNQPALLELRKNIYVIPGCRDPRYNNTVDIARIEVADHFVDSDTETEYDTNEVLNRIKISNKHETRFHSVETYALFCSTGKPVGNFTISQITLPAFKDGRKYIAPEPLLFLAKFRVKKEFRGKFEENFHQKYSALLFRCLIDVVYHFKQPLCFRPTAHARAFYLNEINKNFGTRFIPKAPSYVQPNYPGFYSEIEINIPGGTAWLFDFNKTPVEDTKKKSAECCIS